MAERTKRAAGALPPASVESVIDRFTDILIAWQAFVRELDRFSHRPVSGRIFLNGVESMTTADTTDIPNDDTDARVVWGDRFKQQQV